MTSFSDTQANFVEYIRNPENTSAPSGIEERRLKVYRELFFNNVLGFLSSGFPVLESIYGEQKWQRLARAFFVHHHCRSPYFVDISKEFVEYLSNEHQATSDDPPYLQELAHYEWLELAISIKKHSQDAHVWDHLEDISSLCFSETATLAGYSFPVHQISEEYHPEKSAETNYIVVYRKADFEVGFTVVNAVTAHLLNLVQSTDSVTMEELLTQMVLALPQLPEEQVCDGTKQTIEQLLDQQILLIPNH